MQMLTRNSVLPPRRHELKAWKLRLKNVSAAKIADNLSKSQDALVKSVDVSDEGKNSTIRVWAMPSLRESRFHELETT